MSRLARQVQNLLDECRMLILGGQVLLTFSAEAVLEPGFRDLSETGRMMCLFGMGCLVVGVGLLMWPVPYHRILCRGTNVPELQVFASRVLDVSLAPFAGGLTAAVYVAGERGSGPALALALALPTALCAGAAWYFFPWLYRRRGTTSEPRMEHEPTELADKIREVLTEARMVLPGAQALLGFGALAVLLDSYSRLSATLKTVHLAGLCFIAAAVVLLMTPAAFHRIAERGQDSERLHRIATGLLLAAMAALAPGIAAATWIVMSVGTGNALAGPIAGSAVLVVYYALWFGWPLFASRFRSALPDPTKVRTRSRTTHP